MGAFDQSMLQKRNRNQSEPGITNFTILSGRIVFNYSIASPYWPITEDGPGPSGQRKLKRSSPNLCRRSRIRRIENRRGQPGAAHGLFVGSGPARSTSSAFIDYRMPVALDLPRLESILAEVPAEKGPYGIRGVGEALIVPPPAAIAAALRRLTGKRLNSCPMTPEKVWGKRV